MAVILFLVLALHRSTLMVASLAVVGAVIGGCSGSEGGGPAPTVSGTSGSEETSAAATPTSKPQTPGGATPVDPQPPLEPVVNALQSRDWAAIEPLLQRRPEACVSPFTAASIAPPCPDGSPAGTTVDVFPAAGCHGFMGEMEFEGQFEAGDENPTNLRHLPVIRTAPSSCAATCRRPGDYFGARGPWRADIYRERRQDSERRLRLRNPT